MCYSAKGVDGGRTKAAWAAGPDELSSANGLVESAAAAASKSGGNGENDSRATPNHERQFQSIVRTVEKCKYIVFYTF